MTPRQIEIVKAALDEPESLSIGDNEFIESLCTDGDTPDKYKRISERQDAWLESIAEKLGI